MAQRVRQIIDQVFLLLQDRVVLQNTAQERVADFAELLGDVVAAGVLGPPKMPDNKFLLVFKFAADVAETSKSLLPEVGQRAPTLLVHNVSVTFEQGFLQLFLRRLPHPVLDFLDLFEAEMELLDEFELLIESIKEKSKNLDCVPVLLRHNGAACYCEARLDDSFSLPLMIC